MKFSTKLLQWYDRNGRDLPWRKTRDPYKILVSEIMLQQTQVDRVIDFYHKWVDEFPTFQELAKASNADVIRAWSGLGYNRRALALRDIARQVHNKGVPKTRQDWLALKGVGPYTSAAVSLFSQHKKHFPIDSIIRRVMGRIVLGIPFATAKSDQEIEEKGRELLNETSRYFDLPQALFDLGSNNCSKMPNCQTCPAKIVCKSEKAFTSGLVTIPKKSLPKAKERIHRNKKYPDRIYRGRILKVVTSSQEPIQLDSLPNQIDPKYDADHDKSWFEQMISRMVKDQILVLESGQVSLISE